jgi:hypothetical protein
VNGERARAAEAATLAAETAAAGCQPAVAPASDPPGQGSADETRRWRSVRPPKE